MLHLLLDLTWGQTYVGSNIRFWVWSPHYEVDTHTQRETNEPTTNVDGYRQAVTRLWLQNTSSGHQNRESHVARRLSVARLGTWGACKRLVYPLGLIHVKHTHRHTHFVRETNKPKDTHTHDERRRTGVIKRSTALDVNESRQAEKQ